MAKLKRVTLNVELLEVEAAALAQFLKRMTYSDWEAKAQGEGDCDAMRAAGNTVAKALAEAGFDPR